MKQKATYFRGQDLYLNQVLPWKFFVKFATFFKRAKQIGCANLLCKKRENHFIMNGKS